MFLDKWYGILAFVLFDIVALIAVIAITYRWLFKRILDFLFSGLLLVILSPLFLYFIITGLTAKKRGEIESVFQTKTFIGKKGKRIRLHFFNSSAERSVPFEKLPLLIDVFLGKLSFIGYTPFTISDAEFLDEEESERHVVRPGFINPLVCVGSATTDYDEMLQSDTNYANTCGLFKDCKLFFVWLLKKIRGEGKEYLGKTVQTTYAQSLLDEERITKEDYDAALEYEQTEI